MLWYFAIPVGVIVYGLILWSVFRYRRRPRDDGSLPKQTRYAVRLEITYTLIPVVLIAAIFGFTVPRRTEGRPHRPRIPPWS